MLALFYYKSILDPFKQRALDVVFPKIFPGICNCQVCVTIVFKYCHTPRSLSCHLFVLDELLSREPVNNSLCVVSLTGTIVISQTQERFITHHKWMPGASSMSGNRLKENELATIPLVNERVDVIITSIVKVGKGEECVTVDVEGLHIYCSIRLKRLQFDKAVSLPLEYSRGCSMPLTVVVIFGKSNVRFIVYFECRACMTISLCTYLLKLFKLVVLPFVDDCRVCQRIRNGEKQFL